MSNAETAKDSLLYIIAAEATEAHDDVQNAVDGESIILASSSVLRIERMYNFYDDEGTERTPLITRRAMARSALLYAGFLEDPLVAVNPVRQSAAHTKAELYLASGDLAMLGLVPIK